MGRTKGAINKNKQLIELAMTEEERINILATILIEAVEEE
jgi:hypothetical protein